MTVNFLLYSLALIDLGSMLLIGWLVINRAGIRQRADTYKRRMEVAESTLAALYTPDEVSRSVEQPPAVS